MEEELRQHLHARIEGEASLPYCTAGEVQISLRWRADEDGSLRGHVIARNIGSGTCRIGGKPALTPLGIDSIRLPAHTVMTLEARMPSWVVLEPGAHAAAPVVWSSWCGDPASGRVKVRWEHGEATIAVDGPAQPQCSGSGQPETLWASWFNLVEDGGAW